MFDKVSEQDPIIESSVFGVSPSVPVCAQVAYLMSCISFKQGVSFLQGPLGDENPANDGLLGNDIDDKMKHNLLKLLTTSPGQPLGNGDGSKIYRICEGVEQFLITDINNPAASANAQSTLAAMWDVVTANSSGRAQMNHIPGGANVLYMDGHVQFNRYPGEFPATQSFAQVGAFF